MLRSALLNLLGNGLPLLAGLWAIPVLSENLGIERFGVLALAWVLVGYLSLLDLGLGRALTRWVAQQGAGSLTSDGRRLINRATLLLGLLGGGAALILAMSAPLLSVFLADGDASLVKDSTRALQWLALCVPWVVLTAAWRGVLEGREQFGWVNAIRIPMGIALFAAPALFAQAGYGLENAVLSIVVVRIVAGIAFGVVAHHAIPLSKAWVELPGTAAPDCRLTSLLRAGGWMTVSNVIGPLMVYADRFLIAGLLSAAAVAYYVAPYEIVTRLLIVPAAISAVLLPRASREMANQHGGVCEAKTVVPLLTLNLCLTWPVLAALGLWAETGLTLWLGQEYAQAGSIAALWLAVGVWLNSTAQLSMSLLYAAGRAKSVALLHLGELPFYLLALMWVAPHWGISGVAAVWAIRAGIDAVLLWALTQRHLSRRLWLVWGTLSTVFASVMGLLFLLSI